MSENTVADLDYLSKVDRLERLNGPENPIVIDKKEAPSWRAAFYKVYSSPEGTGKKFKIRTSKSDSITRVIRIK